MVDGDRQQAVPRILLCAHAEVPGPSAAGTRLNQLISAFSDELEVDALTLKGDDLGHIQRLGTARMLRVPVGKKTFTEGLGSYQRALTRQLDGDVYDLVYCADLFSAEIAAGFKDRQGFTLHVEVDDFPAVSFAKRYPVDRSDDRLRKRWKTGQRRGLKAADKIIAMSRYAARVVSEHADPRKVSMIGRAVDRRLFLPPSVEIDLDGRRTVTVFERRGPTDRVNAALAILNEVSRKTQRTEVRLVLLGAHSAEQKRIETELRQMEIRDRVEIELASSAAATAEILAASDIVVVPSSAESGLVPLATPHRALEAMSCRRATILTGPESAFRDVITPNVHALVAPACAPSEVAGRVIDLLDDEKRRRQIARQGSERVEHYCDLRSRNIDFAQSLAIALGVQWTPRVDDDEEDDEGPRFGIEEPRERTVTNMRIPENVRIAEDASSGGAWAKNEDVIEVSESTIGRVPTGPAFLIPSGERGRFRSQVEKARATLTDDDGSHPDIVHRRTTPKAPGRPVIGDPSTESGAFVGSPRGEALKLPHYAKAFKVSSEAPREPTAPIFLGQDPAQMTQGLSPFPGTGVESALGLSAIDATSQAGDDDSLMPAPGSAEEIVEAAEPTMVSSTAALQMLESERKLGAREKTVELSKEEFLKGRGEDDWAPDTVADATPFEAKSKTARGGAEFARTHDRGLLVERDPPDVTLEDAGAASSPSSERSEA